MLESFFITKSQDIFVLCFNVNISYSAPDSFFGMQNRGGNCPFPPILPYLVKHLTFTEWGLFQCFRIYQSL